MGTDPPGAKQCQFSTPKFVKLAAICPHLGNPMTSWENPLVQAITTFILTNIDSMIPIPLNFDSKTPSQKNRNPGPRV